MKPNEALVAQGSWSAKSAVYSTTGKTPQTSTRRSRTTMPNLLSSGSWCCGSLACCGGYAAPPPWKPACSTSRPSNCWNSGRTARLRQARVSRSTRCWDARTRLTAIAHNSTICEPGVGPHPAQRQILPIPAPTSRVAFWVSPICQAMRSTGLADTKPSFGVKLARSCLRSMHWAEEDLRTEAAISTSATGTNDPLTSTRNAELANHQATNSTFLAGSRRQIGFVLPKTASRTC